MGFLNRAPTPTLLGDLFPLHRTTKLILHDVWIGMPGPIVALYDLTRTPDGGLRGTRRCFELRTDERRADVELSPVLVRKGLDRMAQARCVPGTYTPTLDHTDDYPCLEATFVAEPDRERWGHGGLLTIATSSQHQHRLPWGVTFQGVAYTVFAPDLARAFLAWDEAIAEAPRRGRKRRTAILDGLQVDDLDGFFLALSAALVRNIRRLDALRDLRSESTPVVRWTHADRSRELLDHAALARCLHSPSAVPPMDDEDATPPASRAKAAEAGEGPTLFDLLVRHLDVVVELRLE